MLKMWMRFSIRIRLFRIRMANPILNPYSESLWGGGGQANLGNAMRGFDKETPPFKPLVEVEKGDGARYLRCCKLNLFFLLVPALFCQFLLISCHNDKTRGNGKTRGHGRGNKRGESRHLQIGPGKKQDYMTNELNLSPPANRPCTAGAGDLGNLQGL